MISTSSETPLEWLSSRIMFGMKVGLDNIRELCARLGDPQKCFKTIHVAGSNGKGSTASLLSCLGTAAKIRTGLFTSPHLVTVQERFRVDGDPIDKESLDRHLSAVQAAAATEPPLSITFFEAVTAVAFLWFREREVELAILEVGLGGRLDSTNIADSALSVITSISLEHQEILGDSEEEILREKLGVLRPGAFCVHALPPHLHPELERLARDGDFHLRPLLSHEWVVEKRGGVQWIFEGERFSVGEFSDIPTPLLRNRILAVKAFALLPMVDPIWRHRITISSSLLQSALSAHRWSARLQQLHKRGRPPLLIDGAHNPEAIDCLVEALRRRFPPEGCTIVMGVVNDKCIEPMLDALIPMAYQFLFVRTPYPRFRNPEELERLLDGRRPSRSFGTDLESALQCAWSIGKPVVACGSLYLMGALITALRYDYDELEWFRQFQPDENESR